MSKETNAKRSDRNAARRSLMSFGESALGTIGGLLVTFAVCYLVAMAVLWIASRMISVGGLRGMVPTAVVALVLTAIAYLYDRQNP